MTAPEPSADVQPGHDGVVCTCGHVRGGHVVPAQQYTGGCDRCPCAGFRPAAPSKPVVPGAIRCWDDEPGCDCGGRHPEPPAEAHGWPAQGSLRMARAVGLEPPAEAQQDDERRSVYGWVLRPNDRDKAVAEGFLARMYEGMSDDAVLDYIAGALASERDAALAARPSADTETLHARIERVAAGLGQLASALDGDDGDYAADGDLLRSVQADLRAALDCDR